MHTINIKCYIIWIFEYSVVRNRNSSNLTRDHIIEFDRYPSETEKTVVLNDF